MLIALAFTWLLFFISWFEFSPHCCYLENIFFSLYVCLSVCVSKDTLKRKCISIPRVFLNWTPNSRDLWLKYEYTVHFPKSQPFIKICARYAKRQNHLATALHVSNIFFTYYIPFPPTVFKSQFTGKLFENTKPLPNYMLNI